jgi:purine-binding chemotaxis protein CheW
MTVSEPAPSHALPEDEAATRWVCFELGGCRYGIEILRVVEVLADAEIEPVPGAAPWLLGVCNLRGRIITVFDPSLRLPLETDVQRTSGCLIVVEAAGEPIGLRVDRVTQVCRVRARQIVPMPGDDQPTAVRASVGGSTPLLSLLDIDRLLAPLAAVDPPKA